MSRKLSKDELELVYDLIARAIDGAGTEKEALFLSKLSLTLANMCGEIDRVKEAISIAGADL